MTACEPCRDENDCAASAATQDRDINASPRMGFPGLGGLKPRSCGAPFKTVAFGYRAACMLFSWDTGDRLRGGVREIPLQMGIPPTSLGRRPGRAVWKRVATWIR